MIEGKCVKCKKKIYGKHDTLIPFKCRSCIVKEENRDAYFSKRAVMKKLLVLPVPDWDVKHLEAFCEKDSVFRSHWIDFLATHSPFFPESWLESLSRMGKDFVKKKIKEPYREVKE